MEKIAMKLDSRRERWGGGEGNYTKRRERQANPPSLQQKDHPLNSHSISVYMARALHFYVSHHAHSARVVSPGKAHLCKREVRQGRTVCLHPPRCPGTFLRSTAGTGRVSNTALIQQPTHTFRDGLQLPADASQESVESSVPVIAVRRNVAFG